VGLKDVIIYAVLQWFENFKFYFSSGIRILFKNK